MVIPKPEKIEIDFTDTKLTGMAGSLFITRLANQLKLPDLRADTPTVSLPGLEDVRSSKRMGEYLTLFNADAIKALYSVARSLCQQVAPDVIQHFHPVKSFMRIKR